MRALGLPTTATAAVLQAFLTMKRFQPGPLLFENEPALVWTLIASLFIGNTLLLLINLPLAPVWAKLLKIPRPFLYAGILFFATLGAFSVNMQTADLWLLLLIGILGFALRRFGLPILPLILGVIIGPMAEQQLRKSFQLSAGEISGLWSEPVAVTVYIIIAILLLVPLVLSILRKSRGGSSELTAGLAAGGMISEDELDKVDSRQPSSGRHSTEDDLDGKDKP